MVEEILKEVIEKRSWEIVEICEDKHSDLYELFSGTIKHIKKHTPDHLNDDLILLEDIFLQKNTQVVKTAHRLGFSDALTLKEELHRFFK